MTDIKLDGNDDLDLSTGDLQLLTGVDEVRQRVELKLRFFKGEWFLDRSFGVPWFQDILVRNPQLDVVRALLIRAIESEPNVDKVTQLVLDLNTERHLTIESVEILANENVINLENFQVVEL